MACIVNQFLAEPVLPNEFLSYSIDTMNTTHLTETRFSNLELSDSILVGLTQAGFKYCTPIQHSALPLLLRDRDIAVQAQTGTGKTATFLLAAFQRLLNHNEGVDDSQ